MPISNQLLCNMELFCVTYTYKDGTSYEVVMSLRQLRSALQKSKSISNITPLILTKGKELNIEDIKPAKYKGKPYTYEEKYGGKTNE